MLPSSPWFCWRSCRNANPSACPSSEAHATPQCRASRLTQRTSSSLRLRKDWSWMKRMKGDKGSGMAVIDSQHRDTSRILSIPPLLPSHPTPRSPRKWFLIALTICSGFLLVLIPISRFESSRIHKLEFIIWHNQQENVAHLSPEQFTDYLQLCRARVDSSAPQWTVRYDGLFHHRTWTFPFSAPPKNPSE